MSFIKDYLSDNLKNPEFKEAWEASELEYIVAKNIISRRKSLGLTQSDVAARMKSKQSVVSRIEAGHQNVTLGSLKAIADALQTDVPSLFQEQHTPNDIE